MKKSKFIFILYLCLCTKMSFVLAQTITPNPLLKAQCPGSAITYTASPYTPSCHTMSVTNGTLLLGNYNDTTSTQTFTVNWNDNGAKGRLQIINGNNTCGFVDISVPILTITGVPTLTGPSSLPAGTQATGTYVATHNYAFRGTNDPLPYRIKHFTWTVPSGWGIMPAPGQPAGENASVVVTANVNPSTSGSVTTRGNLPPNLFARLIYRLDCFHTGYANSAYSRAYYFLNQ